MEEEFVILFKGKNSIELSYDIKNKESDLNIKIGKHGNSISLNRNQALDLINFIQERYLPTEKEITIGKNYEISTPGLNVYSIKNDSSKSVVIIENHAWEKSCTITIKDK